jgi:hypothetical protein
MAVPFPKYASLKNNYCLSYFGDDESTFQYLLKARDAIEKELIGVKLYIACKDQILPNFYGKRNLISESQLKEYPGRFAYYRDLVKKDDINLLLEESKIPCEV